MTTSLNRIETRTTRYQGEDGKERAVIMWEDYEALTKAVTELTEALEQIEEDDWSICPAVIEQCRKALARAKELGLA